MSINELDSETNNSVYQEAERLIEKARKNRKEAIDLSGMGLTKVPETIGTLTNVKFVYLENNKLREIPTTIGFLPKLLKVYLKNNPLNPMLSAAYNLGNEAVMKYLQALSEDK